ncbi:MAG: hypothetical protein PHQ32_02890 [Firmicutes bacterium]|nr:hypothetical protein [Bacillota bacterium]
MHIHKSKKIIVAIAIISLILFSIVFMDSDEEQYIANVKSTINEIKNYSLDIENIELDKNPEKLIATYEKIIKTANDGKISQPPSTMVKFNNQLINYLNDTITGYTMLIDGTNNKDLEMIKKGVTILSKLDNGFLKQITILNKK